MKWRTAAIASAVVLLMLFFVVLPAYAAYSSLHPERSVPVDTPADYGFSFEEFSVETVDGVTIRGWVINPLDEPPAVFIVMHGYTSNRYSDYVRAVANELASRGYTVIVFDFRGHGLSGGDYTTIGPREVLDAKAVIDYASSRWPGRPIILVGFSMGGAVAYVVGAEDDRVTCVVADSPYYRLETVVPRWVENVMGLPAWYGELIQFYGALMAGVNLSFGPANVEHMDKPLLVVYGTLDPLVTRNEMENLAKRSPYGRLLVVEGAEHVRAYKVLGVEKYVDEVLSTCGLRP